MVKITDNTHNNILNKFVLAFGVALIVVVLVSVLFSTLIPFVVERLYSSPYDYSNSHWTAEEVDLWLVFPESGIAYGELAVNGEVIPVYFDRIGRALCVYIFSEDTNIFRCYGKWNGENEYVLNINKDFLNLGYSRITLTRTAQ